MATAKIKVQEFLSRLPLFNDLVPAELDELAAGTTELHVASPPPAIGTHVRSPSAITRH